MGVQGLLQAVRMLCVSRWQLRARQQARFQEAVLGHQGEGATVPEHASTGLKWLHLCRVSSQGTKYKQSLNCI